MADRSNYDCGPDTTPLQNPALEHRSASLAGGGKSTLINTGLPKGDRDMDDRPF